MPVCTNIRATGLPELVFATTRATAAFTAASFAAVAAFCATRSNLPAGFAPPGAVSEGLPEVERGDLSAGVAWSAEAVLGDGADFDGTAASLGDAACAVLASTRFDSTRGVDGFAPASFGGPDLLAPDFFAATFGVMERADFERAASFGGAGFFARAPRGADDFDATFGRSGSFAGDFFAGAVLLRALFFAGLRCFAIRLPVAPPKRRCTGRCVLGAATRESRYENLPSATPYVHLRPLSHGPTLPLGSTVEVRLGPVRSTFLARSKPDSRSDAKFESKPARLYIVRTRVQPSPLRYASKSRGHAPRLPARFRTPPRR